MSGPCSHPKPCWDPLSMGHEVSGPETVRSWGVICHPCYHQGPCGCPWSVLQPVAMLMFVGHAAARPHWMTCIATWCHVDVHCPGSLQGPYLGPWSYYSLGLCLCSVLWSETMWKPVICVLSYYKVWCTIEKKGRWKEGFCETYIHSNSNSLDEKLSYRILKKCARDRWWSCFSPRVVITTGWLYFPNHFISQMIQATKLSGRLQLHNLAGSTLPSAFLHHRVEGPH